MSTRLVTDDEFELEDDDEDDEEDDEDDMSKVWLFDVAVDVAVAVVVFVFVVKAVANEFLPTMGKGRTQPEQSTVGPGPLNDITGDVDADDEPVDEVVSTTLSNWMLPTLDELLKLVECWSSCLGLSAPIALL